MTGGDSDHETARALRERAAKNRKMETGFTRRQCLNGPEGSDWKAPGEGCLWEEEPSKVHLQAT